MEQGIDMRKLANHTNLQNEVNMWRGLALGKLSRMEVRIRNLERATNGRIFRDPITKSYMLFRIDEDGTSENIPVKTGEEMKETE